MNLRANDPGLRSWVEVAPDSDFPIQNLPFGIFRTERKSPRLATAIGDKVADLKALADHGFFDDLGIDRSIFARPVLNDFMALGREKTRAVRNRLSEILDTNREEWDAKELSEFFLHPMREVDLLLPVHVGDYTDFYSSREHATNVGTMFRGAENALMPNWLHLPVGYHGRASSIVVSGTPVRRPLGQTLATGADGPAFGPSRQLDFELEMALVIGRPSTLGQPVPIAEAEAYIFGLVLFNDWSARDIQRWEYQPLGPFLGKSFASTISPWVVTLDALEPFRIAGPPQQPAPLPYLRTEGAHSLDLHLEAELRPRAGQGLTIARSNFRHLYWSMAQQIAHHTSNGCNLNIGDMMASGTISGSTADSYGSLLELTWRGERPLLLPGGENRSFLEDGDTLTLRGWGERQGVRIGFGECSGEIMPALATQGPV